MTTQETRYLHNNVYLIVRLLDESIQYYRDIFGFDVIGYNYDGANKVLCTLERDNVIIYLRQCQGEWRPRANHLTCVDFFDGEQEMLTCDFEVHVTAIEELYQHVMSMGARRVSSRASGPLNSFVVEECNEYRVAFFGIAQ